MTRWAITDAIVGLAHELARTPNMTRDAARLWVKLHAPQL
jgi:hypothetical protein